MLLLRKRLSRRRTIAPRNKLNPQGAQQPESLQRLLILPVPVPARRLRATPAGKNLNRPNGLRAARAVGILGTFPIPQPRLLLRCGSSGWTGSVVVGGRVPTRGAELLLESLDPVHLSEGPESRGSHPETPPEQVKGVAIGAAGERVQPVLRQ